MSTSEIILQFEIVTQNILAHLMKFGIMKSNKLIYF